MAEAVIASTARSPIGRAGKGAQKDPRPGDLAAHMVRASLAKTPGVHDQQVSLGGMCAGRQGMAIALERLS